MLTKAPSEPIQTIKKIHVKKSHFGHYYECMIITRRWCYIIWSRKWHNLPSQTFMWTVWSLDMHSGQSWGISYFGNTPLWQHYLTYRASKILFIFHFPVIPGSYHGEKKGKKRWGVFCGGKCRTHLWFVMLLGYMKCLELGLICHIETCMRDVKWRGTKLRDSW